MNNGYEQIQQYDSDFDRVQNQQLIEEQQNPASFNWNGDQPVDMRQTLKSIPNQFEQIGVIDGEKVNYQIPMKLDTELIDEGVRQEMEEEFYQEIENQDNHNINEFQQMGL